MHPRRYNCRRYRAPASKAPSFGQLRARQDAFEERHSRLIWLDNPPHALNFFQCGGNLIDTVFFHNIHQNPHYAPSALQPTAGKIRNVDMKTVKNLENFSGSADAIGELDEEIVWMPRAMFGEKPQNHLFRKARFCGAPAGCGSPTCPHYRLEFADGTDRNNTIESIRDCNGSGTFNSWIRFRLAVSMVRSISLTSSSALISSMADT